MFRVFLLCSGLAAIVNLSVGAFFYGVVGFDGPVGYAFSVAIAFLSGMGVSFVLNRRFTYAPSGRRKSSEGMDFILVSIVGLGLTTGIAHSLHWGAPQLVAAFSAGVVPSETTAHIAAVGITAIYSFFAHKYISFRKVGASDTEFLGQVMSAPLQSAPKS